MFLHVPNVTYAAVNAVYHLALAAWIGSHAGALWISIPAVRDRVDAAEADRIAEEILRRLRLVVLGSSLCLWPAVAYKLELFVDLEWFHRLWLVCLVAMTALAILEAVATDPRIARAARTLAVAAGVASMAFVN